jgi:hypothetical protein
MKNPNDVSALVVEAKSSFIEEEPDIAVGNIQGLLSTLPMRIFEFYIEQSGLQHAGRKTKIKKPHPVDLSRILQEISLQDVVYTGGFHWNDPYQAISSLIAKAGQSGAKCNLHIPLDCIYSFEHKSDSGDSWTEGRFLTPKLPVFGYYIGKVRSENGAVIEPNSPDRKSSSRLTMQIWNSWREMADYLTINNQKSG